MSKQEAQEKTNAEINRRTEQINKIKKLPKDAMRLTVQVEALSKGFVFSKKSELDKNASAGAGEYIRNRKVGNHQLNQKLMQDVEKSKAVNRYFVLESERIKSLNQYRLANYKQAQIDKARSDIIKTTYIHGETKLTFERIPDAVSQGYANASALDSYNSVKLARSQGTVSTVEINRALALANGTTNAEFNKSVEYSKQQSNTSRMRGSSTKLKQNFRKGYTKETKKMGFTTTSDKVGDTKRGDVLTSYEQNQKSVLAFESVRKTTIDNIKYVPNQTPQTKETFRYEVTTPDGKKKIFKNKKTADEFIKRISGNYTSYTRKTGTGTTTDPIKGLQPDKSLVSPYLKSDKLSISFIGDAAQQTKESEKYGITQESYIGFSPDGKPIQGAIQPEPTTQIDTKSDNFLESFVKNTYNVLRYSDAVDRGEVPKPNNFLDQLNYYASQGLKPIYNIPLFLAGDKTLSPTFSDTVIDTGIDLALKGKTKTDDPIGDYIRKDPLRTMVQIPSEVALWMTGTKALAYASKGIKGISPLAYQTLKFPIDNKMKTVYRGVTIKDKPILGVQNNKLVKGFDETKLPFEKIDTSKFNRYGWEPTQSTGIASKTVFAGKTLDDMVQRKIITKLDKERIDTFKDLYSITDKVKTKTGKFSTEPIDGLTQKQSDYLLNYAKIGQKKGTVDTLHGSTALQPQISPSLRIKAGTNLKLGDLDLSPKAKKPKNLPKVASKLIQGLKDFPLEKGQSIRIIDDVTNSKVNKQLVLKNSDGTEKKVLEVVLEERDASGIKGLVVRDGTKVLNQKLVSKTVKTKDFDLKIHARRFQLQENMRTALGFHKGKDAQFSVYASEGRSKDIVRSYWNFKEDAVRVGGDKGKTIDARAEHLRSLYNLDFSDIQPQKVLLLSSKQSKSTGLFDNDIFVSPSTITPKNIDVKTGNQNHSDLDFLETKSTGIKKPISNNSILSKPAIKKINFKSVKSTIQSKSIRSTKSPYLKSPSVTLTSTTQLHKQPSSPKSPSVKSPKSPSTKSPSVNSSKPPMSPTYPSVTLTSTAKPPQSPPIRLLTTPSMKPTPTRKPLLIFRTNAITPPKKRKERKNGKIFDFIGSSRSDNMTGLFDRKAITYGKKNIAKINKSDKEFVIGLSKPKKKNGKSNKKSKLKNNTKSLLSSIDLDF